MKMLRARLGEVVLFPIIHAHNSPLFLIKSRWHKIVCMLRVVASLCQGNISFPQTGYLKVNWWRLLSLSLICVYNNNISYFFLFRSSHIQMSDTYCYYIIIKLSITILNKPIKRFQRLVYKKVFDHYTKVYKRLCLISPWSETSIALLALKNCHFA